MIPSDGLMELLIETYDEMDDEEREAWSLADAEAWVHDRRLYEQQRGLQPIECDAQTVYQVVQDFIQAYGGDEDDAPSSEYTKLILGELVAGTVEIRERTTGKTGVANSTQDGRAAVFYGNADGSDDAVVTPEEFDERFEITALIDDWPPA